jgi:tRNA-splicing ligase RtcB
VTELRRIGPATWEIEATGGMLVPGRIFAGDMLIESASESNALAQVVHVAHLPGIVVASMAMPDIHWGYGFPIGGVAATDVDAGGVISPGGVGFDICCGVRLLATELDEAGFRSRAGPIMDELSARIPRGTGEGGIAPASLLEPILAGGAAAAVDAGYGTEEDLARCEEHGTSPGGDPGSLSDLALRRGSRQIGSLGGGNHFLEVQVVDRVTDAPVASAFGLEEGMVCVMIHCGSRGLGHQTCTDHLRVLGRAMDRYGITVPDRQLAAVPVRSDEGGAYLAAMNTSANFAWANRHVLAHAAREAFAAELGRDVEMPLVYDVAHNLAKLEDHDVDGERKQLCVHRKGATRAFGPGHPSLPPRFAAVGQPVLVPGSMGTASWVLHGMDGNPAFASAAHGAGRVMSRKAAARTRAGRDVRRDLEDEGIAVRPGSTSLLAEEAPYAYKDVDLVARDCEEAGLAGPVARLTPLGVVKG